MDSGHLGTAELVLCVAQHLECKSRQQAMQRSSLLSEHQNLRQRLASLRSQDGGGKVEANTWRKRCVSLAVNLSSSAEKDKACAGGGGEQPPARQRVLSGEPSSAAAMATAAGGGAACANASRLQVPAIIHSSSLPLSIGNKASAPKRDANGLVVARAALRSADAAVVSSSAPAVVLPPAFRQLLAAAYATESSELSPADWNAMRLLRMRNVSECSAVSAISLGGLTLSSSSAEAEADVDADDESPPPPSRAPSHSLLFSSLAIAYSLIKYRIVCRCTILIVYLSHMYYSSDAHWAQS